MLTLTAFCQSKDDCLKDKHFRFTRRISSRGEDVVVDRQWVLTTARAAWGWMKNKDGLPMTFAGVLKLFQQR